MANVALWGAIYADVPALKVPKQGGGEATFYEVSGSQTITENDTYDVSSLATVVVAVSGGSIPDGDNLGYGLSDRTLPMVGVGQVGYAEL